jgi:hypothetical protein
MKQSFILKLIAVILFAVFLTTALLFGAGLYVLIDNNMFAQNGETFFDSKMCESEARSYSVKIYSYLNNYLETPQNIIPHVIDSYRDFYSPEKCNLFFTVKDKDGNVLLSNYDEQDYKFRKDYYFTDDRYIKNIDGSFTDKNDKYTITCSVRSQLTANDDFYRANYWFNIIYPARYLCIIFTSVGLFVALVMIVYLISASGHCKGKEGITLNAADRIPFDLYVTMIIFGMFFSGYLISEIDLPQNLIILSAPVIFIDSLLFLSVIMTFAARYKAGHWWKNTVVYFICAFIIKNQHSVNTKLFPRIQ